jgi:cytoskeleton protein RodZ
MTEEASIPIPAAESAGALLRQYREAQGVLLDQLAIALRVAPSKLAALEEDRWSDLPDAMFARALTLAICRQLKRDAAAVLALLPGQDMSRLAPKNERGLDFPLDRPSFLPQSSFLVVARLFTPMRWAALAVLSVAVVLGFWPDLHPLLVFKDEPMVIETVAPPATPVIALPSTEEAPPLLDSKSTNVVVTTVHSAAVAAQAASATPPVISPGVSDVK